MKGPTTYSVEEKKESRAEIIASNLGIPIIKSSTKEEKEQLAKDAKLLLGISVIQNILGTGVTRHGTVAKFEKSFDDIVEDERRWVLKFSADPAIQKIFEKSYDERLKTAHNSNSSEEEKNGKINDILAELALKNAQIKKLLEEEEEKDKIIREEGTQKAQKAKDSITGAAQEPIQDDKDAGKYRLLASLIFFGVLDVLNIVSVAIGHFGEVNEKFYEAVGDVITDPRVMSFFSEINKAFQLDKVVEAFSQFPLLKEFNQSATDFLTSEYLGSFTSIGNDMLASDPADYALRVAAVVWMINNEVAISEKYARADEIIARAPEHLKKHINEVYSENNLAKRAENIIVKETENELGVIYVDALKRHAKDPHIKMSEDLKADLRAIEIKHNNTIKNALDFLQSNDLSEINKHLTDNVGDSQRLVSIASKHRELFSKDKNTIDKRQELLKKSLDKLELTTIKNVLMTGGDNAKRIGERINDNSDIDNLEKEKVKKDVAEKMGNRDGDKVIEALAIKAERKEKMEKIKYGGYQNEGNGVKPPKADVDDFVGSTMAPSSSTSQRSSNPNGVYTKMSRLPVLITTP